jgi:hypothetical protein
MIRQSGQIVNRSDFIRDGINEDGLRWCTGNIFEHNIWARAGTGRMVLGMGRVKL